MQSLVPQLLWTDCQFLRVVGLPIGRRVAVAKNAEGKLVVFSPLSATSEHVEAVRVLGEIAAVVVPSRFHDLFYAETFKAFPGAVPLGGDGSRLDHPDWPLQPLVPTPASLSGFRLLRIDGMPRVQEYVFYQEATRTLVLADLMFNLPGPFGTFSTLLLTLAGMGGEPGPSRLFRSMITDRAAFSLSLTRLLKWDFDRIVPGHGEVIHSGGKRVMKNAFKEWLA